MNQIIQKDCEALYKEHGMEWSRIKNTSILITGACGMLPAYMIWMLIYLNEYENYHIRILALCRSAERAYAVFGEYARKDYFELIMADVTEPFQVEQELDYVIHAASISGSQYFGMDPVGVIMPNVQGTRYTCKRKTSQRLPLFQQQRDIWQNRKRVYRRERLRLSGFYESEKLLW